MLKDLLSPETREKWEGNKAFMADSLHDETLQSVKRSINQTINRLCGEIIAPSIKSAITEIDGLATHGASVAEDLLFWEQAEENGVTVIESPGKKQEPASDGTKYVENFFKRSAR